MLFSINRFAEFIDGKELIKASICPNEPHYYKININEDEIDDMIELLDYYEYLVYGAKLYPEELLSILLRVRMIEYIENPKTYRYDIESLKKILSVGKESKSSHSALMDAIFGVNTLERKLSSSEFAELVDEEEFEENKTKAELIRTLKDVYDIRSKKQ